MQYAVFQWHFLTAVRFGTSKGQLAESSYIMRSDTLFSALCLEALKQGGEAALNQLYQLFHNRQLLISDTMPYVAEQYFLPKPILHVENPMQESSSVLKKAHKKLSYISSTQFSDYLQSLTGVGSFDAVTAGEQVKNCASQQNRVMVAVTGNEDSLPFYVNTWSFAENAGLYLIVAYEEKNDLFWLEQLLTGLGYSGVGGKKTSGLGKFEMDDVIYLEDAYLDSLEVLQQLLTAKSNWYMTLSGALPQDNELEQALQGAAYQVMKRSGFIDSTDYAPEQRKHKNLYLLSAGSCFRQPFQGDIYNVAGTGNHPVYRYAQPLFLGVNV
jgi:CRISPR-associated protein Csm4